MLIKNTSDADSKRFGTDANDDNGMQHSCEEAMLSMSLGSVHSCTNIRENTNDPHDTRKRCLNLPWVLC